MVVDDGLHRQSTGLSEAHKDLIRLLAQIAVEEYLHEIEEANETDEAWLDRATRSEERP